MKKKIWLIIIIAVVLLLTIIKPIRTNGTMKNIAATQLEDVIFEQFGQSNSQKLLNSLEGPIVKKDKEFNEFIWYKKVSVKDTAKIYIRVFKYPTSFSWRDNYFWNQTTMNYNWQKIK
jgi:hypothetical protein